MIFAMAGVAYASLGDVSPDGLTGLWRFESALGDGTATMAATIGTDMVNPYAPSNGVAYLGPWTMIGVPGNAGLYADGGVAQMRSNNEFQVFHGISPNGGGSYVNEYTIAMDYCQTSGLTSWNSLYQTASGAHDNDGDLFTDGSGHIGIGAIGYSTATYDVSTWHRIVLSVDTSSFYRVYVDGTMFLDGALNDVDGRFSLNNNFWLLADDSWEDQWGLLGMVATWDHALTTSEVAGMGGWIGTATTPTPLVIPEPATIALLGMGLALLRRKRS